MVMVRQWWCLMHRVLELFVTAVGQLQFCLATDANVVRQYSV